MSVAQGSLIRQFRTGMSAFGAAWLFFARVVALFPKACMRPLLVVEQVYALGNRTVPLVGFAGFFIGLVMALQLYGVLGRFGATVTLGPIVAITLMRELGPVISALLYAGRSGTALASEIGLMRATEQLSAMEMMAIDPVHRVVAPRFAGGVIAVPLLVLIFSLIGILGAWLVAVVMMGMDPNVFWGQMVSNVSFKNDLLGGIIKSVVFGLTVNLIAVYEGYHALSTPGGVARATTRTVVVSSIAVLALDFLLTAYMFKGL
ncbi:MAG: lipid asymmetry maintenance ABC transporter permease subunit MlaE [Gammaproteobacteria bacterium]